MAIANCPAVTAYPPVPTPMAMPPVFVLVALFPIASPHNEVTLGATCGDPGYEAMSPTGLKTKLFPMVPPFATSWYTDPVFSVPNCTGTVAPFATCAPDVLKSVARVGAPEAFTV